MADWLRRYGWEFAVVGAVIVSRGLYYASGARFDDAHLDAMWHFVSLDLLRTRLLESVFYLHFQPPLYNLYLGIFVQLFGDGATFAFAASYLALGVGFALCLLWLMRRALGIPAAPAALCTIWIAASPATLLFESYLLYSFPVIVWMTAAAASLIAAARSERLATWSLFFGLLALVVLTRALFHPLWLLLVTLVIVAIRVRDRRRILLAAALPLALVAAVCVKNWIVFGVPGTSSWLGMSLARMTVRNLQPAQRDRWIRQGKLSPLSAVRPPGFIAQYEKRMDLPPPTGIPLLDQREKPNGEINLHHLAYVEIARRLARDARFVLETRPKVYANAVKGAVKLFVSPATDWHGIGRNRPHIDGYVRAYNRLVHFHGPLGASGLMLYLLPLTSVWGALLCVRGLRRDRHDAVALGYGFMASSIVFVAFVGCMLEPRENMRFRLLIEPFVWVSWTDMLWRTARHALQRRATLVPS